MSVVHPVSILGAVFCVICSLLMIVYDAGGVALYVAKIVSFCFPHVVDVTALGICIVLRDFDVVLYMCLVYVHGECEVSICNSSCMLYSAGSGVNRVHVVLSGLRMMCLSVSMYV